jgi:hypothetical protein
VANPSFGMAALQRLNPPVLLHLGMIGSVVLLQVIASYSSSFSSGNVALIYISRLEYERDCI